MAGKAFQGSKTEELNFVVRALVALGLVVAFTHFFGLMDPSIPTSGGFFAMGFLLLAGTAGGRLASFFALPQLTGFLLAGLVVGPSAAGLLTYQQVHDLDLLNTLALALIALQAGSALSAEMLRTYLKSLVVTSIMHFLVISLGMMALFIAFRSWLDMPDGVSLPVLLALGFLWGVMCVAKSPAAVVAIISETHSKGPLSSHGIAIVVLTSVLVLVFFSISLLMVKSGLDPYSPPIGGQLERFFADLFASIAAGATIGLAIIFYYWLVNRETLLFLVSLAYGVTAFTNFFGYDTMLVFVTAGIIVANISKQGEKVIQTVDSVSSVVMIIFFAIAGAALHLQELKSIGALVAIMVLGRVALTWIAEKLSDTVVERPKSLSHWGFSPFVAQAGLTFGLALLLVRKLPDIGPPVATLAIAVGAINEIIGPIIFKYGLQAVKETGLSGSNSETPAAAR